MKKIMAMVLALVMVLCATSALAEAVPSKTIEDTQTVAITDEEGNEIAPDELSITIPETPGEEAQAVIDDLQAANEGGNVLDALPEDVKAQIPEGQTQVNEVITAKINGSKAGTPAAFKATITFETPYEAGQNVTVLVGIPGEEIEWVVLTGKVTEDGAVEVVFPADMVEKLGEKEFIITVVS